MVLRLLGSLFQALGPTYDKLYITNFDLRKGNFNFLLRERGYSLIANRAENFIKIIRTLIFVKFKNSRHNEM